MDNEIFTWYSSDKKKLFAQCWIPEHNEHKLIMLVHGLGEHSSRYEHWAERFTARGYTFLSFDLRGHGRSEGKKGHASSLEILLKDIDLMFQYAEEKFPKYKKILYGHSMGGNLVLNHVIHHNKTMDAVIITSPWLKLFNEPSALLLEVTRFLKFFLPSMSISNQLNASQISHDPEVVRNYERDPLVHDRITLKLFHIIRDGGLNAIRNVYKINHPLLIMHGTDDTITSPKASEDYVRNTNKKTRLKLWDHQYHELHNELIKDEVFDYIINWLSDYKL